MPLRTKKRPLVRLRLSYFAVGAFGMLLAKCVTRSHLSVQLFKLLGMARAEDGWRTVPLTSPSGCMRVPLQLLCSSILRRRRRSPMKRLSFVACRLSRLSPRTYLKDLAGAGGTVGTVGALAVQKAKRRRGLAWTLERLRAHTQVSPGSWAGTSLPLSLSLISLLSLSFSLLVLPASPALKQSSMCVWALRCDLPFACCCCSLGMFVS